MIVQLGESATLSRLQIAVPMALVLIGAMSALDLDPRALALFVAAALLRRTFLKLNPRGISIKVNAEALWEVVWAGQAKAEDCVVHSRGRLPGLVWLQCLPGGCTRGRRDLLIFADAVDADTYRILRRTLKTRLPASS